MRIKLESDLHELKNDRLNLIIFRARLKLYEDPNFWKKKEAKKDVGIS